jgi:hypothetical protein
MAKNNLVTIGRGRHSNQRTITIPFIIENATQKSGPRISAGGRILRTQKSKSDTFVVRAEIWNKDKKAKVTNWETGFKGTKIIEINDRGKKYKIESVKVPTTDSTTPSSKEIKLEIKFDKSKDFNPNQHSRVYIVVYSTYLTDSKRPVWKKAERYEYPLKLIDKTEQPESEEGTNALVHLESSIVHFENDLEAFLDRSLKRYEELLVDGGTDLQKSSHLLRLRLILRKKWKSKEDKKEAINDAKKDLAILDRQIKEYADVFEEFKELITKHELGRFSGDTFIPSKEETLLDAIEREVKSVPKAQEQTENIIKAFEEYAKQRDALLINISKRLRALDENLEKKNKEDLTRILEDLKAEEIKEATLHRADNLIFRLQKTRQEYKLLAHKLKQLIQYTTSLNIKYRIGKIHQLMKQAESLPLAA